MTYVMSKILMRKIKAEAPDLILDIIEQLAPELPKLMAKEEVQRIIYSVGVLIGNGAKSGVGLGTKGGKFKFEDLLGSIAPQILAKFFGSQQSAEQPQQPQTGNW